MKASNDTAAYTIAESLEDNLFEPNKDWPETIFKDRSYARWAAMELANKLMDRPYESPDLIIEEFMFKMKMFSIATDDPEKSRIFTIAKETAEDILTLF